VSVVNEKQKNVNLGTLGNFQLPLAASTVSESDSVVRVQDGQIVAIGGLMRHKQEQNASGLPGATGNPVLGTLLGSRSSERTKSELVMLLKPTIIRDGASRQGEAAEIEQRLGMFETHTPASPMR
jgi:MSHA biogenesis protein MshL